MDQSDFEHRCHDWEQQCTSICQASGVSNVHYVYLCNVRWRNEGSGCWNLLWGPDSRAGGGIVASWGGRCAAGSAVGTEQPRNESFPGYMSIHVNGTTSARRFVGPFDCGSILARSPYDPRGKCAWRTVLLGVKGDRCNNSNNSGDQSAWRSRGKRQSVHQII